MQVILYLQRDEHLRVPGAVLGPPEGGPRQDVRLPARHIQANLI